MDTHPSRRFHIVIDAVDCDTPLLADKESISRLMLKLAELAEMKILDGPHVVEGVPANPGLTAFAIIDFSHISIHTFTRTNEFCLDLFSCKEFNYQRVVEYVKEFFAVGDDKLRMARVQYNRMPLGSLPPLPG